MELFPQLKALLEGEKDVITTGAIIDACYEAMKHVPGVKISVVS